MKLTQLLRTLVRVPMFTVLVVATLAIGIGANTAIFSVIEGVLLRPLPFPKPDELVVVDHTAPGVHIDNIGSAAFLYFVYREEGRTFQDIGMWTGDTVSVTGLGEPEEVRAIDVTDAILPILGAQPALGRLFTRNDDAPDSAETVVLSYAYWREKFGGDPSVIGRRVILDGRPREVIGVVSESFRFLDQKPSFIVPLRLDRSKTRLGQFNYTAIARLKAGTPVAQASADVARMIPMALTRFPAFEGFTVKMFEDARIAPLVRPLRDSVTGDIGSVLWVLMGTVGVVLLIACANVANLLLVRAEGRQQELAIRAALGADRGRLTRELLVESLMLSGLGGVLGLALSYGALRLLKNLAPANLLRLDEIGIDGSVLLFTVAVSLAAGLLFGAIPALKHAGPHLAMALRAGGRALSQSKERRRARSTLVIVQVALAVVLLVCSGLMIRTFQALRQVPPGFSQPEHVQTLRIFIPESAVKDPVAVVHSEQQILDKLAAIPGVSSVGLTTIIPMDGNGWHDVVFVEDHPLTEGQLPAIRLYKFISPGLLQTLGNRLIAGRDFTWTDIYEKRPVVMVSENLARELWHDPAAAIGKRVRETLKTPWHEIVGVVGDEHDDGLNQKAPTTVLWPILMENFGGEQTFCRRTLAYMIRSTRTGSSGFVKEIGQAVWSVNPNLPLANVRTLREVYDKSLARTTFTLVMLAIAGAMALLLGIAGIYGVISYSVSQRTREIGIRMALGARGAEVMRMFVGYGFRLAGIGVACGLASAMALTRLMSSLLFNVSPSDPLTLAAVSVGLVLAAVAASYLPAARATSVNPVDALRAE